MVRKATLASVQAKAAGGIRYNEHLEFFAGAWTSSEVAARVLSPAGRLSKAVRTRRARQACPVDQDKRADECGPD